MDCHDQKMHMPEPRSLKAMGKLLIAYRTLEDACSNAHMSCTCTLHHVETYVRYVCKILFNSLNTTRESGDPLTPSWDLMQNFSLKRQHFNCNVNSNVAHRTQARIEQQDVNNVDHLYKNSTTIWWCHKSFCIAEDHNITGRTPCS